MSESNAGAVSFYIPVSLEDARRVKGNRGSVVSIFSGTYDPLTISFEPGFVGMFADGNNKDSTSEVFLKNALVQQKQYLMQATTCQLDGIFVMDWQAYADAVNSSQEVDINLAVVERNNTKVAYKDYVVGDYQYPLVIVERGLSPSLDRLELKIGPWPGYLLVEAAAGIHQLKEIVKKAYGVNFHPSGYDTSGREAFSKQQISPILAELNSMLSDLNVFGEFAESLDNLGYPASSSILINEVIPSLILEALADMKLLGIPLPVRS